MRTEIYIKSVAAISPLQRIEEEGLVNSFDKQIGNQAICIEPNYKEYISPIKSRRMSKVLKMTWVTASMALKRAQLENPQMISVATGMGCVADTTKFLEDIIENKEEFPKPTAFINSTHNTPAGFLAIGLKSKGQNFTFTHNDLNFEHALLDVILKLQTQEVQNALLGAVDETTPQTHLIKEKMGLLRPESQVKSDVFKKKEKGYIDSEASVFMIIDAEKTKDAIAKITALEFEYEIENSIDFSSRISEFLMENQLDISDIDIIIGGDTGDKDADRNLIQWRKEEALEEKYFRYKDISGEFMSSAAFGMWLATMIIKEQNIPNYIYNKSPKDIVTINNIFLINHNGNNNYSFILMAKNV